MRGTKKKFNKKSKKLQKGSAFKRNPLSNLLHNPKKDVFWITGAPTEVAYDLLKKMYKKSNGNLVVIICADLPTYQKSIEKDKTNVYNQPTNFRTHYGKNIVKVNEVVVGDNDDNAGFKKSQNEIANSLSKILNFVELFNIPVFFAMVPRDERSLYLEQDEEEPYDVRATNMKKNPDKSRKKLENCNLELTQKVLEKLVIPAFGGEQGLKDAMRQACLYHATFLADVLTVGCALLMNNENFWNRYSLISSIVDCDGNFPKKGCVDPEIFDGLSYLRANFQENESGLFRSFANNSDNIREMDKILEQTLDNPEKIWNNSIIFHDDRLNDIDDLPALMLIKTLSNNTVEFKNYIDL